MIRTRRLLVALVGVLLLLVGSAFAPWAGSAADRGVLTMPGLLLAAADTPTATPSSQECTTMDVSNAIKWYALDSSNQPILDQPVQSYPSGSKMIAAGFDYNCIPKATYITTVFYYGGTTGDPAVVTTSFGQPSTSSGTWWNSFYYTDGTPLADGEWYVEFYRNVKDPLASGHITVGAKTAAAAQVGVQGTVLDRQSRTPIAGASLTLLNPGVSGKDWANNAMDPADVYASGQSDANGQFTLDSPIDRNVSYVLVVIADGHNPYETNVNANDQQSDPISLTIELAAK